MTTPPFQLPDSLNLPPHLSAHKYFLVCTLTVAAWDTLVLSPRTWKLARTPEWPVMKILFHFMRVFMPAEFAIVAVAFFSTTWTREMCGNFYLFEPICTAVLLACASTIHVIRIHAIYEKSRPILFGMGALLAIQIVVTAVCCAFYRSVPLKPGQGCIAGPRENWVGIYWLAPTILYSVSFGLAVMRSINSLQAKPLTKWKLMLRDGLNLYGAIWIVNMANMLFWFIIKPTDNSDSIKTIVTSMAAVLTTSMTLRIVLNVRGTLAQGGSFALSNGTGGSLSTRTTHVISTRSGGQNTNTGNPHTYTLGDMRTKPESEWVDESKSTGYTHEPGVKVTVDREVEYDGYPRK